jgi:hypothetical protein
MKACCQLLQRTIAWSKVVALRGSRQSQLVVVANKSNSAGSKRLTAAYYSLGDQVKEFLSIVRAALTTMLTRLPLVFWFV